MSCALAVTSMVATKDRTLVEEGIRVSLARTKSDFSGAFRLLYKSYLRAGLVQENAIEMRLTPYHLLPSTEVLVAKYQSEVISTLTMVTDGEQGLPMESMYAAEIAKLRSQSLRVAEMGSLADRRQSPVRFASVFAEMARMVVQVAESREVDALVLASHPRHAKLYERTLGFEQIGDLTSCPYAQGNPAVALLLQFDRVRGTDAHNRLIADPIDPWELQATERSAETTNTLESWYAQQQVSSHVRIAS